MRFVPQDYTVGEPDDNVTVNVRATGFPVQDFDIGNVSVFLFTEDVTAVGKSDAFYYLACPLPSVMFFMHCHPPLPPPAGLDYVGAMRRLFFSANGEYEVTIFILDNSPVEVSEVFEVQLSSDSDLVVFDNFTRTATVEIIDDDRESTSDTCPHAIHSINTLSRYLHDIDLMVNS